MPTCSQNFGSSNFRATGLIACQMDFLYWTLLKNLWFFVQFSRFFFGIERVDFLNDDDDDLVISIRREISIFNLNFQEVSRIYLWIGRLLRSFEFVNQFNFTTVLFLRSFYAFSFEDSPNDSPIQGIIQVFRRSFFLGTIFKVPKSLKSLSSRETKLKITSISSSWYLKNKTSKILLSSFPITELELNFETCFSFF